MRISGVWRAFDVDDSAELFDLVGRRIESVESESTDWGKPVTAIFQLGDRVLTLAAVADELISTVRAVSA